MNKLPPALWRRLLTLWNASTLFALALGWPFFASAQPQPQRLNNLASLLLEAAPTRAGETLSFTRPREGWIFISAVASGEGQARLVLDGNELDTILLGSGSGPDLEAMWHVTAGSHVLRAANGSKA